MNKPNYTIMREAYAIIGGIPEHAFDLSSVVSRTGESLECGTIACAAGWLAMHPTFKARGIRLVKECVEYKNVRCYTAYTEAMAAVFKIDGAEADYLFGSRTEPPGWGTDKEVWLKRMYKFLDENDELTAQVEARQLRKVGA